MFQTGLSWNRLRRYYFLKTEDDCQKELIDDCGGEWMVETDTGNEISNLSVQCGDTI